MIKELVDILIALLELGEAELKSVRRGIAVLGWAFLIGGASILTILGALVLLVWALYLVLETAIDRPGALSICALTLILVGGLSLCYTRKMLQ